MRALIDLDPLVYQYGDMRYPDGEPLPANLVASFVVNKIESIVDGSGASSWSGYLTFGPDNFRIKVATIKEYKGNRNESVKPVHYEYIRGFLSDIPNARMIFGMEADDALSIEQYSALAKGRRDTVICTLDKDLTMVPGYHYRWSKGSVKEIPTWYQTEIGGLRCFYKQLLTGDAVDNIHGLYGVGPKSAHLAHLDKMDNELDMKEHVLTLYKKWYGNYAEQFMTENGKLLWMKRSIDDDWRI